MLRCIIIFLLLSLSSSLAKAGVGCVVGSTIYASPAGSAYNKNIPGGTLNPGCFWVFTTDPGTPCSLNGGGGSGFLADTVQECRIDDGVWLMLVAISSTSYFAVRKKLKFEY